MVEWSSDTSAADWIVDRIHPFATDVGSFVPEGFPAYARILHPAWRTDGEREVRVRWAELAEPNDTPLRVTTWFEELEESAAACDAQEPRVGTLDEESLNVLIELLAAFTSTPRACWFCVWEGYGWMHGGGAVVQITSYAPGYDGPLDQPDIDLLPPPAPPGPRVHVPGRSFALYPGPIEAASAFCRPLTWQSPNIWWPEDHAWCVTSEIDFRSTYLGGSEALVDRVLSDERLEALPAEVTDRVSD